MKNLCDLVFKVKLTLSVVFAFFSVSAIAGGGGLDNRYVIETLFGQAAQKNYLSGTPTLSGSDYVQGVRGSVYVSKNMAFEVSYYDNGVAEESYIDGFNDVIVNRFDSNSLNIGFKGGITLSKVLSLVGRVGVAMWELDFSETDTAFPGEVFRDQDQGTDTYAGIGLQMNLENNFQLTIEYLEMDFSPVLGAAETYHSVETVALTAGVRF